MNEYIEELKVKLNKKLENYEIDKKIGQLSVDNIYSMFPNEIEMLLNYINQLETNRYKAIEYATNEMRIVNDNEYHKLLEILRGKDE